MELTMIAAMNDFDFEYWKNLAVESRSEFEIQRCQALQEFASKAPASKQPALNALIHTLCVPQQGTAMERAINAQVLLNDSLSHFHNAWSALSHATGQALPVVQALLSDLEELDQQSHRARSDPV